MMRFGSVCSGIEAASVAWGSLGWTAAWFSEIEPFPSAVLAHHYPETPNLGDMTLLPYQIATGEVEAPDLFCGGTPCQAFSVAGLRQSLDDARGNLSLTFCEIANAIDDQRRAGGREPCIVFWENVPGVLSTKDNAFGCFLAGLAGEDVPLEPAGGKWTDAGAVLGPARAVAWRTLDAQFFGLAQRRRRVFVVASARDDFDPVAVLLEFDGVRRDSAPSREAGEGTARGAAPGAGVDFQNVAATGDLCGTLMGQAQKKAGQAGHGGLAFHPTQDPISSTEVCHAIGTGNGQGCATAAVAGAGMQVRRLTPRECERLQGFPDDWTLVPYRNKPAADGPRYKALGNSWAVPVVRWIGQRIALQLLV